MLIVNVHYSVISPFLLGDPVATCCKSEAILSLSLVQTLVSKPPVFLSLVRGAQSGGSLAHC